MGPCLRRGEREEREGDYPHMPEAGMGRIQRVRVSIEAWQGNHNG